VSGDALRSCVPVGLVGDALRHPAHAFSRHRQGRWRRRPASARHTDDAGLEKRPGCVDTLFSLGETDEAEWETMSEPTRADGRRYRSISVDFNMV
jgi:hypothetical protein